MTFNNSNNTNSLLNLQNYLIQSNEIMSESELSYYEKLLPDITPVNIDLPHCINIVKCDITTLNVSAIVNPANTGGLGCFQPSHKCLDNIIHRRAGPRLRDECRKILQTLGTQLETPKCIITHGYKLPCKYVIHVAGPDASQSNVLDFPMLLKCYDSCIKMAQDHNLPEIAFPCISTGLFGYPEKQTAQIVLQHLIKGLENHNIKIILVCYTDVSFNSYKTAKNILSHKI